MRTALTLVDKRTSRNMRRFFFIPLAFALAGCAGDSDLAQAGNLIFNSLDKSAEKIPRERAAAVPYATMGIELGSSAQALLMFVACGVPVRHIVEHCTVDALRWSFDNEYWEDRMSGYVWRSSQHIHPKSPPLILEVLRPEQNNPS